MRRFLHLPPIVHAAARSDTSRLFLITRHQDNGLTAAAPPATFQPGAAMEFPMYSSLDALESVAWHRLRHAQGTAKDLPGLLRQLAFAHGPRCEEVRDELAARIAHEGSVYSASAQAVPFLLGIVVAKTPASIDALALAEHIAHGIGDTGDDSAAVTDAFRRAENLLAGLIETGRIGLGLGADLRRLFSERASLRGLHDPVVAAANAIRALPEQAPGTIRTLTRFAQTGPSAVHRAAGWFALKNSSSLPAVRPLLVSALNDPSELVRHAACRSLAKESGHDVQPVQEHLVDAVEASPAFCKQWNDIWFEYVPEVARDVLVHEVVDLTPSTHQRLLDLAVKGTASASLAAVILLRRTFPAPIASMSFAQCDLISALVHSDLFWDRVTKNVRSYSTDGTSRFRPILDSAFSSTLRKKCGLPTDRDALRLLADRVR